MNSITNPPVQDVLASVWRHGFDQPAPLDRIRFSGDEPGLPSSFRVGVLGQATIGASALAAAEILRARTGHAQDVAVEMTRAMAFFRSERYATVDGKPADDLWDKIFGAYPTGDGRHVRLHTNFEHHRDGVLKILGCAYDREAVAASLMNWEAEAFEAAASEAGLVVSMVRSFEEWDRHPQAKELAELPLMEVVKIGEAPPTPLPGADAGDLPLAGIRMLDLTRVLAGPVAGRAFAAHGADVMMVTAPHLPSIHPAVIDTGRGKLSSRIDLRTEGGRARLADLARQADVFMEAYRPGGLARFGFAPEDLAALNPGIVAVRLSAYGHAGPWAEKRGFDSLVQGATGINVAEGEAAAELGLGAGPRPLPAQALDHAAGYLMAFGAMAALKRRAEQGGSWLVRVSLAQTGRFLRGLGRLSEGLAAPDLSAGQVDAISSTIDSGFGRLHAVDYPVEMSLTPPRFDRPSVPLGAHDPVWPAR